MEGKENSGNSSRKVIGGGSRARELFSGSRGNEVVGGVFWEDLMVA